MYHLTFAVDLNKSQILKILHVIWMCPPVGKVDSPYSTTLLTLTPIFERYVVLWGSKTGYQKDMRLRVQNMITVVGSLGNIIGGVLFDHFNEHENLHFDDEFDLKITRKVVKVQVWIC